MVWAAGVCNIILNVDNRRIASRKPILLQTMLMSVVRLFWIVGLQKNIGKAKAIVCTHAGAFMAPARPGHRGDI